MIRMNDFGSEPEELRSAEMEAITRVLASGRFILGPEGEKFQSAWADFCGTDFCVGVANGMEALELGLRALEIGADDEVITTPVTAIATVMAITRAGATPVLADIEPGTALLDRASVERCLTSQTKAVLLVHLYGQLADMENWIALCERTKIHLLEDAAQAHGASRMGKRAGAFGEWAAFSFYPTKNLGAKGDAGALVMNSAALAERVTTLRNYGSRDRYEHTETGMNSRLDELQACILRARLPYLKPFNVRRQEIAARYRAEINNPQIELLSPPDDAAGHVYHLFVIHCRERDRLSNFLKERGIETLIHYPIPAHRQEGCRDIRIDPEGLPNAERHAAHCLSIPCHPQLRDEQVTAILAALNDFA